MLVLPRAALLVVWTNAWLAGEVPMDAVVSRVTGADEPHEILEVPGETSPAPLARWLGWMRAAGAHHLRLALPAPGDPLGLAGPAEFNELAIDAGQAAVTVGGECGALIPDVRPFGPPGDIGHEVIWRWMESADAFPDLPTLAEADRDLAEALLAAGRDLTMLDMPSWRDEAADLLADLRSKPDSSLPGYLPQRAHALVARALRLSAVVNLALADDGGAASASAAQARRAALEPLERSVRRALVVACSSVPVSPGSATQPASWVARPPR